jgi:hypothetical protein
MKFYVNNIAFHCSLPFVLSKLDILITSAKNVEMLEYVETFKNICVVNSV